MALRALAAACLILAPFAAYGDIAGMDANSPRAEQPAMDAAVETSAPLLVIRFNQRHIYFEHALQQAISAAQRAKPDVVYRVVSAVPKAENSRTSQGNAINARAVIDAMQRLGVPPSRIGFSTQALESGDSQEVRIYVQ